MIGDIPPPLPLLLGWLGPRGPFCMPLRISISPMSLSPVWPPSSVSPVLTALSPFIDLARGPAVPSRRPNCPGHDAPRACSR